MEIVKYISQTRTPAVLMQTLIIIHLGYVLAEDQYFSAINNTVLRYNHPLFP